MRTISISGVVTSCMLFFGLLAGNLVYLWFVFGVHIIGLIVLSRNDDMLLFLQEHTRAAELLEVAMYTSALLVVVLALNDYFFFAALATVPYGATWLTLLKYAPPFPGDFGMFHSLPENWRDDWQDDDK